MKERPILFSGPMVRAILDGRKTMTRRVVKPQLHGLNRKTEGIYKYADGPGFIAMGYDQFPSGEPLFTCPYGQPCDRLWVRETFCYMSDIGPGFPEKTKDNTVYKADIPQNDTFIWRPSIFMPRKISRILIEITDIRVERLQDISEEDARHEGMNKLSKCSPPDYSQTDCQYFNGSSVGFNSARDAFQVLWDTINAKRNYGWDVNPWVWVVEFKRIDND